MPKATKATWPDEAAVFERSDGTLYECVDVSPGRLRLLCRVNWFSQDLEYEKSPRDIKETCLPRTPLARAMLAIAKESA